MSKVLIHLIVSFDKLAFGNKQKYVKSPISKMCNDKYSQSSILAVLRRWEMRASSNIFAAKNLSSPEKAMELLSIWKLKWAWAKLVEEWKNLSRQCVIISAKDECEKAGELCPSALLCLRQEDGSFACDCDVNSKVVGEGDARTCQGTDYF